MDEKTVNEVAQLLKQIEGLNHLLDQRDEQIKAIKGYLQQQHVEPTFLPA